MTYEEFINNILETRGRFACGNEYHERHHIMPKCMGGTDDEDNLIDLFTREHFEAHRLLALENLDVKGLVYAWHRMSCGGNDKMDSYKLTPELNEYFFSTGEIKRKYGISNISRCINGETETCGKHPITGEKLHWIREEKIT